MSDVAAINNLVQKHAALKKEIAKIIIGQQEVIDLILLSVYTGGHSLLIDILGSEILDQNRNFKFIKGPVFSNIILADEINRTPPKTQAALLEAMQERAVTIAGHQHKLELPYFVLATQNPIEQEGTYPLPEAQLDRFMFAIELKYPSIEEEVAVVKATTSDDTRASQNLILGAKAHAAVNGKFSPDIEDVQAVAMGILRHRIIKNYKAEAEGISEEDIIRKLF